MDWDLFKIKANIKVIKHIGILLLSCFIIIFGIVRLSTVNEKDFGFIGDGNLSNPYQIGTTSDIQNLRDWVNRGEKFRNTHFIQTSNIDLRNQFWIPIGGEEGNFFSGIYDGNGFIISYFQSKVEDKDVNIFFGLEGIIANLGVVIENPVEQNQYFIVTKGHGLIVNSYIKSSLPDRAILSIANNFDGIIEGCWSKSFPLHNSLDIQKLKQKSLAGEYFSPIEFDSSLKSRIERIDSLKKGNVYDSRSSDAISRLNGYLLRVSERYSSYQLNKWLWDGDINHDTNKFKIKDYVVFAGDGSRTNPYLISDYKDLILFRDLVNAGCRFSGVYFEQTNDIDLNNENWIPIGPVQTNNAFFGIYDGGGFGILNLNCSDSYGGFFGKLGGTVANLNILNGKISGDYVGGIASASVGNRAIIINSSNNAELIGRERAGGIADNFSKGYIENCYSTGKIESKISAGICAYNASNITYCYSLINPTYDSINFDGSLKGTYEVEDEFLKSAQFINLLNDNLTKVVNGNRFILPPLKVWHMSQAYPSNKNSNSITSGTISFFGNILLKSKELFLFFIFIIFVSILFLSANKLGKSHIISNELYLEAKNDLPYDDRYFHIPKKLIVLAAYIICTLPLVIFVFGWFKLQFAVLFTLIFGICLYRAIINQTYIRSTHIRMRVNTLGLIIISMILLSWISGVGGYYYQSPDYHWRNAIFNDLVKYPWPVFYQSSGKLLVYYIFYWLPPALLGKVFGLQIGNIALLIWTSIIFIEIILLIQSMLDFTEFKQAFVVILIFIIFSGLDIFGVQLAIITRGNAYPFIPLHLEWWAYEREYSSNLTQIMWVFNQSLIPWILVILYLLQRNMRSFLYVGLLMLPHGPIPFLGFLFLPIIEGLSIYFHRVRTKNFLNGTIITIKEVCSPQNLLIIFPIYCILKYLSSNDAINSSGLMLIDFILDKGFVFYFIMFIVLEVLVYSLPLFIIYSVSNYKLKIYSASLILLVIPFFQIGSSADFALKASIPALFVLMLFVIKYLLFVDWKVPFLRMLAIVLIIVLSFGAITPITEQTRALRAMFYEKRIALVANDFGSLALVSDVENFTTRNIERPFFKLFIRNIRSVEEEYE